MNFMFGVKIQCITLLLQVLISPSQAPHLVSASSSPRSRKLLTSPPQAPHLAETSSSPRENKLLTLPRLPHVLDIQL
jgi:hypothetical protein